MDLKARPPWSFSIRKLDVKDNHAVRALFVSVWRSFDLGTVTVSLQSPGGLGMCFVLAVLIDRVLEANFKGSYSDMIYLALRVATPVFALVPVAGCLFLRSMISQSRYITQSLPTMRGVSRWVCNGESRASFVCCSDSGQVVGCIMVNKTEIVELAVSGKTRRQGVASKLVEAAEEHCLGILDDSGEITPNNKMQAVVTSAQPAAIALYTRGGYVVSHRSRANMFSDQDFLMIKDL